MSRKGLLKQKRRGEAGALQDTERATTFAVDLYDTGKQADCQPLKLSVDSLSRCAFIAGDLGCFLLGRLPGIENLPDPNFNPLFEKAILCLEIEDTLLRKAAEIELAGGQ